MTLTEKLDLKTALRTWCEKNEVSITDFATRMGYIYQHGWSLLSGKAPITVEVVGRFVLVFGVDATSEVLDLAGLPARDALTLPADHHNGVI